MKKPKPTCPFCGKSPVQAQNRCKRCYKSAMEAGEITRIGHSPTRSVKERLLDKVKEDPSGCWLFQGYCTPSGYGGMVDAEGKARAAHRLAYEAFVGPIPAGLHIDHLCRVRNCVNPAHLEAVAQRTNTLRGISFSAKNAQKTHCDKGHEYTPENTYYRTPTHRVCRICNNAAAQAYYRRKHPRP